MDIKILNKDFNWESSIDQYTSFIWTERFSKYGDFELYLPMDSDILDRVKMDDYVSIDDSDRLMIIENRKTITDPDEGPMLIVSGRSLESILTRRVEYALQNYYNNVNFQTLISEIFGRNILVGSKLQGGTHRAIPNFIFKESTDERIMGVEKYTGQTDGVELYTFISDECRSRGLGFSILLEDKNFVFELLVGEDRSYNQQINPWIIFSPDYGNLLSSEFLNSNEEFKNCIVVTYDSGLLNANTNGWARTNFRRVYISSGSPIATPVIDPTFTGINCRETHMVSTEINQTPSQSWANMDNIAKSLGLMQLGRLKIKNTFSGVGENTNEYIYKKDYFLGDLIQLEDEFGNSGVARLSEYTICDDVSNGFQKYPTFEMA